MLYLDINRNSTDCLKLSKEKLSSTQVPDSQVDDKLMISSVDDSSIKDIWKILNQEPSSPSNNEGSGKILSNYYTRLDCVGWCSIKDCKYFSITHCSKT